MQLNGNVKGSSALIILASVSEQGLITICDGALYFNNRGVCDVVTTSNDLI